MTKTRQQAGDTLVEVLLAMAVLSAVVVGAVAMMNRGQAVAMNALERSQVTALLSGQADLLRYARQGFSSVGASNYPGTIWRDAALKASSDAVPNDCLEGTNPFYINKNLTAPPAGPALSIQSGKQSLANSGGTLKLWINANKPAVPPPVGYIDYHVKACWDSIDNGAQQQAQVVVRLYVP